MTPVAVRVVRDINEIDPAAWDGLLGPDDVQQSHRFVRVCQESRVEGAEFWHLILEQGGAVCATASLCRMCVRLDLLSADLPRGLIEAVRRVWPSFLRLPVLFCGPPVSFGQPLLRIAPGADVGSVCAALAETMEDIAARTDSPLLCWKEFDDADADRLSPLLAHGYFRAASLPSCSLRLDWRTFEEYLGAMTAGYRRQARATLRAGRDAGLSVRIVEDSRDEAKTIYGLYREVIERARFRLETLNQAFIERLASDFRGQSRAVIVEREGRSLAVAVLLQTPGVTTFLLAGLDYAAEPRGQAYPFLVLEVIAEAIRRGSSRLEMGQTSYPLKTRLGAEPTPRSLFLRYRRPLGDRLLRRSAAWLFPETTSTKRRVFRDGPAASTMTTPDGGPSGCRRTP